MGMEKERMKIMKKITVWNRKGGVGKTTISINLAYELHRKGEKVLCLDLDGQANLTSFFEADMAGVQKPDLARILDANSSFFHVPETDREVKLGIYPSRYPGIHFIRGSRESEQISGTSLQLLDDLLEQVGEEYDFCILDCHPDFSMLSQNAVYTADLVLVPILLDGFSRDNLNLVAEDILQIEETAGYEIPFAAVANRVMNRKSQRQIYEDITYRHDYPVLQTCIRDYAVVGNALLLKKPISEHRKASLPALDFKDLAFEILQKMQRKGVA